VLLWPLTERFAVSLGTRISPVEGVRVGYAVGPREGFGLSELLSIAASRMEEAASASDVKGVEL
jgi:hypothetical protein